MFTTKEMRVLTEFYDSVRKTKELSQQEVQELLDGLNEKEREALAQDYLCTLGEASLPENVEADAFPQFLCLCKQENRDDMWMIGHYWEKHSCSVAVFEVIYKPPFEGNEEEQAKQYEAVNTSLIFDSSNYQQFSGTGC